MNGVYVTYTPFRPYLHKAVCPQRYIDRDIRRCRMYACVSCMYCMHTYTLSMNRHTHTDTKPVCIQYYTSSSNAFRSTNTTQNYNQMIRISHNDTLAHTSIIQHNRGSRINKTDFYSPRCYNLLQFIKIFIGVLEGCTTDGIPMLFFQQRC